MTLREELQEQGNRLFRYRSFLPLILVGVTFALEVHQEHHDVLGRESGLAEGLEALGPIVAFLGLSLRVFTVGYTPARTSGRNTSEGQVAECLNSTGAYSLVRNPLYLGNYLMWAGIAMATGSLWILITFTLTFWIYYERIVFAEEEFLRGQFGTSYLEWAARTPVFLPLRLSYRRPDVGFSWRKVVRNEKNGVLALLLLLCLLGLAGDAAEGELSLREERISIAAAALGLLLYVVAKAMARWTDILREPGR